MNKELSPLEAYEKINHTCCLNASFPRKMEFGIDTDDHIDCESVEEMAQCLDIIETALKENAELKKMIRNFNEAIGEPMIITPSIEKKLKALEIVKNKRVDVGCLLKSKDLEDYNFFRYGKWRLTQEEYDLLKKVLL